MLCWSGAYQQLALNCSSVHNNYSRAFNIADNIWDLHIIGTVINYDTVRYNKAARNSRIGRGQCHSTTQCVSIGIEGYFLYKGLDIGLKWLHTYLMMKKYVITPILLEPGGLDPCSHTEVLAQGDEGCCCTKEWQRTETTSGWLEGALAQ